MDAFGNNFNFNMGDMDNSFEPVESQDQEQSGEPLLRPPFSENQGRDVASEATEGLVILSAEEQEVVDLFWEELNAPAASEPAVPTGPAPLSESQEAWGRSQGVEEEDVSGNDVQAVPTGVALLTAGPGAWDRSHEQQQLSGIGAQFEPFDVAPPLGYPQAYPQSQQHVSGDGAWYAAPGFPSLPAGFGPWGQRAGFVPAGSIVDNARFGVQQANLPPPPQFSAQLASVAPSGLAPSSAGSHAWNQGTALARVDSGVDAGTHLGGQQANLPPPLSANPAQFSPPGVVPLPAGHVVYDQRGEASRVNARVNDVHFPAPQANFAPSLWTAQPTTLAHRPLQPRPPMHHYGGQGSMVPGVPLAPAPAAPAPAPAPAPAAPAPAPAPRPAPPVLNPYLPPAPAAPRRTGRGKGNPYGPQNFPCAQCDFATGTKEKLVSHERIHFEPTHFCTFNGCIKRFWSDKDLKRHVDTHFPERAKKFTCESCGKEDKRKDNHKRHVETCKKRKRGGEGEGEGGEGEGEGGDGGT